MLSEVLSRHVQLRRAEVGDDFETPPGRSFRMVVFGEIVSASNFDSLGSKLFVHYFVNLPVGWTASEETTSSDLTGEIINNIKPSLLGIDYYFQN
jgi:hypothetical protein